MEHKTQKIISLALAFLLLSGIFAAVPALVGAEGASDLASQIKGFAHGGTGELDAVASGGTVTVTGKVTGAAKTLKLKIDSGTTVVWKAEYSGSPPNYMVHLQGGSGSGGTFEVAQGGSLVAEGDSRAYAIEVASQAAHVALSGGLVSGKGTYVIEGGISVTVSGGTVENTGNGVAIYTNGDITVSGGLVISSGSAAIRGGDGKNNNTITVSGGTVANTGTGVVMSSYDNTKIKISGGLVESRGHGQTISAGGDVSMSGGEVRSTGDSTAIIMGARTTFEMSGGVVSANFGYAVSGSTDCALNINGGFVFAYGTTPVGKLFAAKAHVVGCSNTDAVKIGGNAVVCAWDQAAGKKEYQAGSYDELISIPAGAAKWAVDGFRSAIAYANGSNTGIFHIPEITVSDGKSSPWANKELQRADELGLIPDSLRNTDLKKPINRAEFAAVSVRLYENLSGEKATPIAKNPFADTSDAEVLKAYNLGITAGTSADKFTPDGLLNREQAATMLTRVWKKYSMPGWTLGTDGDYALQYTKPSPFSDDADISAWARDSVYFMAANGIILGSEGKFKPKNTSAAEEAASYANATREQALLLAVRIVEKLK